MIRTSLRGRLDELAPRVRAYRRLRGYDESSRVTIEQLDRLESQLGLRLPEEYHAFLTRFGTGGFGLLTPGEVYLRSRCDMSGERAYVSLPFAVTDGHGLGCCPEDEMLHGSVPIAENGCAFYTALAVTSASAGTVWRNDYAVPGADDLFCWAPAGITQADPVTPLGFLSWIEQIVAYHVPRRPRRWFLPRRLR